MIRKDTEQRTDIRTRDKLSNSKPERNESTWLWLLILSQRQKKAINGQITQNKRDLEPGISTRSSWSRSYFESNYKLGGRFEDYKQDRMGGKYIDWRLRRQYQHYVLWIKGLQVSYPQKAIINIMVLDCYHFRLWYHRPLFSNLAL